MRMTRLRTRLPGSFRRCSCRRCRPLQCSPPGRWPGPRLRRLRLRPHCLQASAHHRTASQTPIPPDLKHEYFAYKVKLDSCNSLETIPVESSCWPLKLQQHIMYSSRVIMQCTVCSIHCLHVGHANAGWQSSHRRKLQLSQRQLRPGRSLCRRVPRQQRRRLQLQSSSL